MSVSETQKVRGEKQKVRAAGITNKFGSFRSLVLVKDLTCVYTSTLEVKPFVAFLALNHFPEKTSYLRIKRKGLSK